MRCTEQGCTISFALRNDFICKCNSSEVVLQGGNEEQNSSGTLGIRFRIIYWYERSNGLDRSDLFLKFGRAHRCSEVEKSERKKSNVNFQVLLSGAVLCSLVFVRIDTYWYHIIAPFYYCVDTTHYEKRRR